MTTNLSHLRGWLAEAPAASIARIDAQLGKPLQISEAGRTRARQQELWDLYYYPNGVPRPASQRPSWLGKPARPGTSPHEAGNAIDTNSTAHATLRAHGWRQTVHSEPWHWVYNPALDTHRTTGAGAGTSTPTKPNPDGQDDLMRFLFTRDQGGAGTLWTLLNVTTGKVIQTRDQERANSWAEAWGSARTTSVQGLADAVAAVAGTK